MPQLGDDEEQQRDFLKAVANDEIELDWFPSGIPCVRYCEKDPKVIEFPHPQICGVAICILLFAKLGSGPAACPCLGSSAYTGEEFETILKIFGKPKTYANLECKHPGSGRTCYGGSIFDLYGEV